MHEMITQQEKSYQAMQILSFQYFPSVLCNHRFHKKGWRCKNDISTR